ncbi:MAG: matrixin family metalloprotease [Bryobacteraceae bacterium]
MRKSRDPRRVHRIVQFGNEPGASDIARVKAAGARALEYVPFQALLVASAPEWDPRTAGAVRWETIEPADKWSAELDASSIAAGGLSIGVVAHDRKNYLVEFFPGVSAADSRAIAIAEGMMIRERPDLRPNHLLVEGSTAQARKLTGWEEVAYVFPSSDALDRGRPVQACAGALTASGAIGQYVDRVGEGWDGPGAAAAQLGYRIRNVSSKIPEDQGRAEIERALLAWAKVARVTFVPASQAGGARSLDISFASGAHGDPFPFDGAGKVLAHTFYPAPPNPEPLAGDMHLDDAEPWRVGTDIDLYSVVLHELGHALGLGHSDKPGAVMYAYYQKLDALTEEDIRAVRTLYAAREEGTGDPDVPTSGDPEPSDPEPSDPPAADPPANDPPANDPPSADPPSNDPGTPDKVAPVLRIVSPASSSALVTEPAVIVRGSASDNVGVTRMEWSLRNASGEIVPGANWTAEIPVIAGINTIVIRAWDAAGNSTWRSVSVTRR